MGLQELSVLVPLVSGIVTLAGVFVGALLYVVQRQLAQQIEFDVDAKIFPVVGGPLVAEAVIVMKNKGKLRIRIPFLSLKVRALKRGDDICKLDEARLKFPHSVFKLASVMNDSYTFVEPGITQHYRLTFSVPEDSILLLIHGEFYYNKKINHTAEKLVEVFSREWHEAHSYS